MDVQQPQEQINPPSPSLEPTPPTPLQQPAIISPPPTSKSPLLPILLAVLITSALFIGGYFGYQQFIATKQPPAPTPTPTTVAPTPDPTVDWPIYSSAYGYSFKYPPFFEIKTSNWNQQTQEGIVTHEIKEGIEAIMIYEDPIKWRGGGQPRYHTLWLEIHKPIENPQGLSSLQFAQQVFSKSEYGSEVKFASLNISGKTATKTSFIGINIYIPNNQLIYQITYSNGAPSIVTPSEYATFNHEEIENLISQIFSTFKFIDTSQTQEKQFGFIKSITKEDNTYSLSIDYAEMLSGDQAIQALIDAGECDTADTCDLPNGYYISNENAKLRTFTINPNTKVQLSILSDNQTLSLDEFSQIFTSKNDDYRKSTPYWITIENNQITHIKEQYLP